MSRRYRCLRRGVPLHLPVPASFTSQAIAFVLCRTGTDTDVPPKAPRNPLYSKEMSP